MYIFKIHQKSNGEYSEAMYTIVHVYIYIYVWLYSLCGIYYKRRTTNTKPIQSSSSLVPPFARPPEDVIKQERRHFLSRLSMRHVFASSHTIFSHSCCSSPSYRNLPLYHFNMPLYYTSTHAYIHIKYTFIHALSSCQK